MTATRYTIKIDQSAITAAPNFPRSVEWWRGFLPVWFSDPQWWDHPDVKQTYSNVSVDDDSGQVVIEARNKKHAANIETYLRTGVLARYIPESAVQRVSVDPPPHRGGRR